MSTTKDFERAAKRTTQIMESMQQAIGLKLFNSIIQDTPVDTGRARGNWQATIGAPAEGETDRFDFEALEEVQATAPQFKIGSVFCLTNNLPYIHRLEYGYSKQSPDGMVRRNVARIQAILRNAASENKR